MPDLQTEIFKKVLPNMNNLKFDDMPDDEPEIVVATTPQKTNVTKAIWEYVKLHPHVPLGTINKAFPGLGKTGVATRLSQMKNRGNIVATPSASGYRYSVASDTYKALTKEESLKKAAEAYKKHQQAKQAKAAKAEAKAAKVILVKQPASVAPPEIPARKSTAALLDTLSIVQARELYDELRKIFGGDFQL